MESAELFTLKKNEIFASEIAEFLNCDLKGPDFIVQEPLIDECDNKSVISYFSPDLSDRLKHDIQECSSVLVLIERGFTFPFKTSASEISFIEVGNPKLEFINVLREFFVEEALHIIHPKAIIEEGAVIGKNVAIGANTIIGSGTVIGENTIVGRNVVVSGKVKIGRNCVVKDNATIGSEGFGFEYNELDIPIHVPQIGEIIIGNNVWIGSSTTVEKPATNQTIIENHVKIDDLVQIGHNCIIGDKSLIMAGVILSRGVKIGKKCWISPNATIKDDIVIGDMSQVGLGAVVLRDVPSHSVFVGNPARYLRKSDF